MRISAISLQSKSVFDKVWEERKKPSAQTEGVQTNTSNSVRSNVEDGNSYNPILQHAPNLYKRKGAVMSENLSKEKNISHSNYSRIPNIIYELGWSPYKIVMYCLIKRVAGENGVCTKSYKTLAKQSKCSLRKVKMLIKELCENDKILKKPLIFIEKRKTESGDSDTNSITINDIWKENQKMLGGAYGAPPSAQDALPGAPNALGGVVHMVHQGGAYGAPKEESFKKTTRLIDSDSGGSDAHSRTSPPLDLEKKKYRFRKTKNTFTILTKEDAKATAYLKENQWEDDEIDYALEAMVNNQTPIGNWIAYMKAIIENLRKDRKKQSNQGQKLCQNKPKTIKLPPTKLGIRTHEGKSMDSGTLNSLIASRPNHFQEFCSPKTYS